MERNSKAQPKTKPLFIAIDTDFLRSFSYYICGKDTLEEKRKKSGLIDANIKYFDHIKNLYEKNLINLVVTSTVYNEVKHSSFYTNFIKDYCLVPQINFSNYQVYASKVARLANAYCFDTLKNKDNTETTAMHPVFSAAYGDCVATNDAYIMAEATVLGVDLLTCNNRDFIQNTIKQQKAGKSKTEYGNDICKGIVEINKKYGFVFESAKDVAALAIPRPYPPHLFANLTLTSTSFDKFNYPKPNINSVGEIDLNLE